MHWSVAWSASALLSGTDSSLLMTGSAASIPGGPELGVILFIFVVMFVVPAILIILLLIAIRRRAPGLEAYEDIESDTIESDESGDEVSAADSLEGKTTAGENDGSENGR
ncbi:hypothetical protein ACLI4U_18635 [Natrialbaceae archaeon A-CW2]|uniref:hypothetical protein n=1 Tax=Natronosalvus amylolyticus TaxID=2961994 RepID=UPI0020C950AE|nr:hypothetical protein [Natronosalvus amylolyticus]